eukprot:5430777-Lingulodinium_polyedra.AAC.1
MAAPGRRPAGGGLDGSARRAACLPAARALDRSAHPRGPAEDGLPQAPRPGRQVRGRTRTPPGRAARDAGGHPERRGGRRRVAGRGAGGATAPETGR